jgi:argininosuccinate lyase
MKKELLTIRDLTRQIDEDVYKWLGPASSIKKRNTFGRTGPDMVKKSLNKAKQELNI